MKVLDQLRAGFGDGYAVDRLVGERGKATVFRAIDRKSDRAVALTVFRPVSRPRLAWTALSQGRDRPATP